MTNVDTASLRSVLERHEGWPTCTNVLAVVTPDTSVISGDADLDFRIASVSKLLTAWAIHIAAEEGTVTLEDEVGPPGATLGHLLAHASGLPFEGREPIAKPEAKRIYSNSGYEIAAEHVVARSGVSFARYLREAVFEPLGMKSTLLAGSPAKDVHSTVHDLSLFAGELLRPTLLSRDSWRRFATNAFGDLEGMVPGIGPQSPCPWGMGAEIRGLKSPHWTGSRNSGATFGHFGATGSFLWVDPVADVVCLGLSSLEFGEWAMVAWPDLADAVLTATRTRN